MTFWSKTRCFKHLWTVPLSFVYVSGFPVVTLQFERDGDGSGVGLKTHRPGCHRGGPGQGRNPFPLGLSWVLQNPGSHHLWFGSPLVGDQLRNPLLLPPESRGNVPVGHPRHPGGPTLQITTATSVERCPGIFGDGLLSSRKGRKRRSRQKVRW